MPNGLSSFKLKTHITLDKLVIYLWVGMGANYRVLFGIDHQLTLDITFPLNHHSDDIMDAVASTEKDELQLKRSKVPNFLLQFHNNDDRKLWKSRCVLEL